MQSKLAQAFKLPKRFPSKRILSVDIGGTLAKTAFYVPQGENTSELERENILKITQDAIPSK